MTLNDTFVMFDVTNVNGRVRCAEVVNSRVASPHFGLGSQRVRRDAAGLADLVLLDDLVLPVAVGVFGPWARARARLSA
jgi:hypothetical protein